MNEKNLQLKAVLSDEAFVKSLLEAENEEAVQKMLADKGVEMSVGEIELMGEMLEAKEQGNLNMEAVERLANGGELSEDELEQAAGGTNVLTAIKDIFLVPERSIATNSGWVAAPGAGTVLKVNRVAAAVVTVAALGYGVYDAVRRRW